MDHTSPPYESAPRVAPQHLLEALQTRAHALWTNARALVRDHTLLALLEVQRASMGLVKLIGAAVIISVLVVTAWMALVTAFVMWIIGAGVNVGAAVLIAAVVNLVAAAAVAFWARAQVPDLLFAATVRQLKGEPPPGEGERHG
jgi:hypothetical protein